jgi:predicted RecA/RadA family phage recombinase
MPEALVYQNGCALDYTPAVAVSAGEIRQLACGRAGVLPLDIAAGSMGGAETQGVFKVTKKTDVVVLDGAPLWWDASAGNATPVPPLVTGDLDYYLGCAVGDQTAAATTVYVNLNVQPAYIIDFQRDGGDTVIVKTVVGSTTVEVPNLISRGGSAEATFGTTAEAQKVDWISKRSFPVSSNWILEAVVEVVVNADADVADLNVGVANETHASDADSITESVFFHWDLGADFNLDAESDDGTTEVAATDTTIDWAVGTPIHLVLDGRDHTNVKYYVNGVEVLAATANLGDITHATGPLKALFHLEKSANDSPGTVQLDMLRVRCVDDPSAQ